MPSDQLVKDLTASPVEGRLSEFNLAKRPHRGPGRPVLALVETSLTVQLSLLMVALYLTLWGFYNWRPLAELDIPAWWAKFKSDPAQAMLVTKPPVITLGTSLIGAPVWSTANPNLYQEILSAASGQSVPTDLIYTQGAVMSDQAYVVHKLFADNKKVSLIVLTYSPRDFLDNVVSDPTTVSPAERAMSSTGNRQSFWPANLTWTGINDCISNHIHFGDLLRRHWLTSLAAEACKTSHHPLTLWDGAQTQSENNLKEAAENAKRLKVDLAIYNRRYNPYNERRATLQLKYLDGLLKECQAHKVPVQMIGMPLSPANKQLLKPGVYENLDRRIRAIAARYNVSLVDINTLPDVHFVQSDFTDSVHVSKSGADRFIPIYTKYVLQSPGFARAFPPARH